MVIIFNYKINERIGKGSFSSVHAAHNVYDETQHFAIKIIKITKASEQIKEKTKLEVDILYRIKHNNIIKLHDSFYHDGLLYLVFERCRTDLHTEICEKKDISIDIKLEWINQLMSALIYLHNNKIIHRDLKPHNILLDRNNELKLIDFGFSRYFESEELMNTVCGSPLYMSPELFINNTYDYKSDYWSMGVIIYLIIVGNMPYNAKNMIELESKLRNITDIKIPLNIRNDYDVNLISMVESMLIISTKYRISYNKLLKHPFIVHNKISDIPFKTKHKIISIPINNIHTSDDLTPSSNDDILSPLSNDDFDLDIEDIFNNNFVQFDNNKISSNYILDNKNKTDDEHTSDEDNIKEFITNSTEIDINTKSKPISIPVNKSENNIKPYVNTVYSKTIPTTINKISDYNDIELDLSNEYLSNNIFVYKNYFSAPVKDDLIDNIKMQYEPKQKSYLDLRPIKIINNVVSSVQSSLSDLITQQKNQNYL